MYPEVIYTPLFQNGSIASQEKFPLYFHHGFIASQDIFFSSPTLCMQRVSNMLIYSRNICSMLLYIHIVLYHQYFFGWVLIYMI